MKPRLALTAQEVNSLYESLARRLGDTSVPSLPQVAAKIIELFSDSNSTFVQFANVIQSDAALTGRLLRLANSAMFAQRQPVTRLERAMVLMGMERLKAISLGFHLSKAMTAAEGPYSLKRIWTQSLFRAWLALHLVESIKKELSGEAFIIGMLSDAGMTVMTKLAGEDFQRAVNPIDPPARQYLDELKTLEFTHVDASAVLCRLWKLPDLLARPIGMHHTPAHGVSLSDPSSLLHAAAYYVCSIPLDAEGSPGTEIPLPELARKLFGKEPEEMQALVVASGAAFKATREMFAHLLDKELGVDAIIERATRQLSETDEDAQLAIEAADHPEAQGQDQPSAAARRFETGGMILELEPAKGRKGVMVFISDSQGNRLVSEEIDPLRQSDSQVRELLMLEGTDEPEVAAILGSIRKLAA